MADAQQSPSAAAGATTISGDLIDQAIKATTEQGLDESRSKSLVDNLVQNALRGTITYKTTTTRSINETIKDIDKRISKQLAAVMHAKEFQKLEGSWRGLRHLVFQSETSTTLKIRVLNVQRDVLYKDLSNAREWDQNELFKKIYEGEFGVAGGAPFGALVGDYEFKNHPEDIDLLGLISGVAAGAHCPFISAASSELFGMKSFTEMNRVRDLAGVFDTAEYIKWNAFRDTPDSRFVSLVCPRVLARLPYGEATKRVSEFGFEEVPRNEKGEAITMPHDEYCWMNAAYAYAANLTRTFAKTNWCTAIRGRQDGVVEGLPIHTFPGEDGATKVQCPTEVEIPDRRDAELSKLGFMGLIHYKNTDYSVFFSGQTCNKPLKYDRPAAQENAQISARLPYIMASSRIAHFLKMIGRDMIGTFKEAQECQDALNRWISQYVLANDKPDEEQKARYPLKEAKITVEEVPGQSGVYHATALLRPWLQMEELTVALSMVAEIPKSK